MPQSEEYYAALKARGVPVEYVLFPDEGHGWRKIPNRVTSTTSMVAEASARFVGPASFAGITGAVDRSSFTKRPTSSITSENCANENGVDIELLDLDSLPMLAAVSGPHQISSGFIVGFELIYVDLTDDPAIFIIDRCTAYFPGIPTVSCLQQSALATRCPASVLIEKENGMQPRHRARTLTSPRTGLCERR